jgi:hypothetical protein
LSRGIYQLTWIDALTGDKNVTTQTMKAMDAVDLIAEYIAHGLTIPLIFKQALDAETLEALNDIEDRLHASDDIENPHECDLTSIHSSPADVLCAQKV